MKKSLTTLFLSFIANFSFLSAQEAWLLEMPNKYSDYLIKKSLAEDHDTVASIIEKLPDLITSKQAREIDLLTWKAVDGKIHKNKKITEGTATITAGVRYYSLSAGSTDHRKISIIPPVSTQRTFKIETFGRLSRVWSPTFVHRGDKLTLVLLERHAEADTATISLGHKTEIEVQSSDSKDLISWYSSDSLDTKQLIYYSRSALAANPRIKFGSNLFIHLNKEANSLLRVEQHKLDSKSKNPESLFLYHNEARFEGHTQSTGPLKEEVIKIKNKSFAVGEKTGTWTLTLANGEPAEKE